MAKIAFLGLGQMGAPMARRLIAAGHQLTVWNRTADRANPLLAEGAAVAGSPAQAGAAAEFPIMLATPTRCAKWCWARTVWPKALGAGQVTSTCRPSARTPSCRSPPNCPRASPWSMRPSGVASPPRLRVDSRCSWAPAKKSSSGCVRSSSRSVPSHASAPSVPALP